MDSTEKFLAGVKQLIAYCDENKHLEDPVLKKILDDYLNEGQLRAGCYRGVAWEMYLRTPALDQLIWGCGLQHIGWYCTIDGLQYCPTITWDDIKAAQDEHGLLESGLSFCRSGSYVAGGKFHTYYNFQEERASIFEFIDACIAHTS